MNPTYGIYQAIVTDNSQFFTNGKIKVRVQNMYNGKLDWDLNANFDYNEFIQQINDDLWAVVYTPIGGGSNHGLFALPQINSVGIVQFMNGNIKKPIWMGSFFRPEYDEDGKLQRVNVPNDQPGYETMDGISQNDNKIGEKKIKGGFGTLILRTKTTSSPTRNSPENMNFGEQRSENLIVLSEEEVHVTHFSKWENDSSGNPIRKQYEELILGTDEDGVPEIQVKVTDIVSNKTKTTSLVINNEEVALKVTDEKKFLESSISSTSDGININAKQTNSGNQTSIQLDPKEILLVNKKVSFLLEGNEATISVPNGKLRLSGQEVLIGDGGGYIVTKDSPTPMRMEDGTILKCSKAKA